MPNDNKDVERAALTKAFVEHKSTLASYLAHKFLSQSDIDDLLQDTYEQALLAVHKHEIHSPKGFLFGVTRNLLSKRFAKNSRRLTIEISDAEITDKAGDFILPEQQLYYKFKMEVFLEAIKTLPPQCRRVIVLRKLHGLPQKKIASKLKISRSTVERHITIGLARINTVMIEKGYSEEYGQSETPKVRNIK